MTAQTPFPLPRQLRESTLNVGDGTAGPYGPSTYRVWDVADVKVFARAQGEEIFTEVTGDCTIAKTAGEPFDTFSVTFGEAVPATTDWYSQARRTHERMAAATQGGALSGLEIEKELSRQATVLSELRRDADRALKVDLEFDGALELPVLGDAQTLLWDADAKRFRPGPDAGEIEAAQGHAAAAHADRDAVAADKATVAGYKDDAAASAGAAADAAGRFINSETEPATRADGSPLQEGDLWFNTDSKELKVWDGADWYAQLTSQATRLSFTATCDGDTDTFALDARAEAGNTIVMVDGRGFIDEEGYTLSAGELVLSEKPAAGVLLQAWTVETTPIGRTSASLVSTATGQTVEARLADIDEAIAQPGQLVTPQQHQAAGDGSTDDTAALQAMFDAVAAGAVIYLGGKTYKYSTLTIATSCTIWGGHLASAKANAGAQITVAKTARVVWMDVELSGGGSKGTYVGLHDIVRQQGTSRTDRAVGMAFYRCYVHGAGMHGLWTRWADDVVIEDCHFANVAYACIGMESPRRFRARGGLMDMLGAVGTSANAYGMYLSHDTTNYSSDANAGTPVANNHFPIDCNVTGVTFHGPEIWEALDFHGGYQMVFAHNKIYACKYGIMAGNSSGAAANYAGYENIIANNVIDVRKPDGTSAGVTPGYGITIQGGASGTLGSSWQLVVTGNIIRGYGNAGPSTISSSIHANVYVDYVVISNNVIMDWTGYGIIFSAGAGRVICATNIFERMRAASGGDSACIRCDSSFTGHLMAIGNLLDKGGNQPVYGLRNAGGGFVNFGSDFRSAGTEYSDASGNGRSITWA